MTLDPDREAYMGRRNDPAIMLIEATKGNEQTILLGHLVLNDFLVPVAIVETVKLILKTHDSLTRTAIQILRTTLGKMDENTPDRKEVLGILEAREQQGF